MRIFITGGAGFIGSRLVKRLFEDASSQIHILDNLHEQVHGPNAKFPEFSQPVTCTKADIRQRDIVEKIIADFDPTHVVHLAAETGTSQSMDEIQRYCEVNIQATAILAETLLKKSKSLKQIVLASSRAIYGEGPWQSAPEKYVEVPQARTQDQIDKRQFNPLSRDGKELSIPLPAHEDTPASPTSIYASTKLMQEYLLLQSGLKPKSLIFRFQNVYGAGQSLRNPYTGVLSIFTSQLLKKQPIEVYEDGDIVRDFVYVDDIVDGLYRGLKSSLKDGQIVNLGSGTPTTIKHAADLIAKTLGLSTDGIRISGKFRAGDIRYACADITRAKELLDWEPTIDMASGIRSLVNWSKDELAHSR